MKKLICIFILLLGATLAVADQSIGNSSIEIELPLSEESLRAGSSEEVDLATPKSSTEETTPEPSPEETTTESSTEETPPPEDDPDTCLGKCPAVDSYRSVYLANERCDRFCQCAQGRAVVLPCPDGLHFNIQLDVCDWPQAANCTGEGGLLQPSR